MVMNQSCGRMRAVAEGLIFSPGWNAKFPGSEMRKMELVDLWVKENSDLRGPLNGLHISGEKSIHANTIRMAMTHAYVCLLHSIWPQVKSF
jgi:hypothetical protein